MSSTKAIEMTIEEANFETLTEATLRVDEAERKVRVAALRMNTLVPGTPLRYGVEATRRLHAADAELEAARVRLSLHPDLLEPGLVRRVNHG